MNHVGMKLGADGNCRFQVITITITKHQNISSFPEYVVDSYVVALGLIDALYLFWFLLVC